jgi:hypothetical protein
MSLAKGVKEVKLIKKGKLGIIYGLIAEDRVYIGYEYDRNVESEIKDLLVRARSYEELGYLYEASYEVLKYEKIKLKILVKEVVNSKVELAYKALNIMLALGDKCVNIWDPVCLLNGSVYIISKADGIVDYIKSIDDRKLDIEKGMIAEYENNGYDNEGAKKKVKETYKMIMDEIRKDKEDMYNNKII